MNCGFDYSSLPDSFVVPAADGDDGPDGAEDPDGADTFDRPAIFVEDESHTVVPPLPVDEPGRLVGGRSAPVLLGLIVAGGFVLILIFGAIVSLLGGGSDSPSSDASDSTATGGNTNEPTPSAAGEIQCWDGTTVALLSDCSDPVGVAGLSWVFPSFNADECRNRSADPAKPAKWTCRVEVPGGGEVQIRYREHKSVKRPFTTYTNKYGPDNRTPVLSAREDVERYVWRATSADNNGVWSLSSMYAEYPWSVTVKGTSSDDVEAAFTDNVSFRNPRRFAGGNADA